MKTVIDQMLVKAGAYFGGEGVIYADFDPKKFAELVRAAEREAIAQMAEPWLLPEYVQKIRDREQE